MCESITLTGDGGRPIVMPNAFKATWTPCAEQPAMRAISEIDAPSETRSRSQPSFRRLSKNRTRGLGAVDPESVLRTFCASLWSFTSITNLHDRDWVAARLAEGLNNIDIARLENCSPAAVCKWLKKHGLTSPRANLRERLNDKTWMTQAYVIEGRNASQVAGILGCDRSAVLNALRRHGIPLGS